MTNDYFLIALKELNEYFKEEFPPNGYPTIDWAITEIERLRSLVTDLRPFMEQDVKYALEMGPFEEDHDQDDCEDCLWYSRAVSWDARIKAGDLDV